MVGRKSGNGRWRIGVLLITNANIDGHVVLAVLVVSAQSRVNGVVLFGVRVSLPGRAGQSPSRSPFKNPRTSPVLPSKKNTNNRGRHQPPHHHSVQAPLQHGFSANRRSPTLWPTREGANAYWIGPMPICLVLPLPFTSLQHVSST